MSAPLETSTRPGAGRRWDRHRVRRTAAFLGAVGLGLLLVVLLALSAQRPTADLDPEGTGPDGARALAEVLRQQGVEVEVVRSIDALAAAQPDAGTTVFVGDPTDLGPGATARLADAGWCSSASRAGSWSCSGCRSRASAGAAATSSPGATPRSPARTTWCRRGTAATC